MTSRMPPPSTLTGSWYGFMLLLLASLLLTGAVASYSYASRFLLGPLEGVPLDATGRTIAPQKKPVLLIPVSSAVTTQIPALKDENLAWRRLLQALGHPTEEAGLHFIPTEPVPFPLVILPWGSTLSPEQAEKLEQFLLAGGGALLAGPALPEERLRRVLGIHPLSPPPALAQQHFFARVRLSSQLVGRVLPPLQVRLNGEGLRSFPSQAPFVAGTEQPLVTLEPESDRQAWQEVPTLLHRQRYGKGRVVWLGAPLSQLYAAPERQRALQPWLEELLPWLAGQPVVHLAPTPGPGQQSVAITLEAQTLHHVLPLLELLEINRLPSTLFLPVERLEEPAQDRLRQRLPHFAQLELAVLGTSKLSVLAPAVQRSQLLNRRFRLEQLSPLPVVGYLEPWPPSDTLSEALLASGYRYRLEGTAPPSPARVRASRYQPPVMLGTERPLRRAGASLLSPEQPLATPVARLWHLPPPGLTVTALRSEREPPLVEQWKRLLPAREQEQLTNLRLDVSVGQSPERLAELEELLALLKSDTRYRVQTLSAALTERESLDGIEVLLQPVGPLRLHLRLVGGPTRVSQLRLHVQLPTRTQLVKTETHQPLASAMRHYALGDEAVMLEVESLAANDTVDYFLALERVREWVDRP